MIPTGFRSAMRARLAIVLVLVLILPACSQRALEARALLEDVAAGPGPSGLKETVPPPRRAAVAWTVEGRPGEGDLYLPTGGATGRLVLVPGLSPDGRDDPRLVALANSLGRVRFAVLAPEIASLRQLRASPADARVIADAAVHLAGLPLPQAPRGPVGVVAVSYAVGPAVLAALDPAAAERIAFVMAIGGYFDMTAVVTYITTGQYRRHPDAPWRRGQPNPAGKWRFAESNADRLDDPRDRAIVMAIARRRLADSRAPIADLAARLGPDGRAVLDLLTNTDPDAVPRLIARLPEALRRDLAALSLATHDLSRLRARLLLIHGRDDPVIPATESRRLAESAPAGRTELFLVDTIGHVDFAKGGPHLFDQLTLWDAAIALLEERDTRRVRGLP